MKVALVTGASKGIGKACALRLARDGYTVVVNYSSSDEAANATLDQIKAEGGDGMIYKANVADLSQVKVMVREVFKAYGRIDVLVNNAGITKDGLVMRMSEEQWDAVIDVNMKSAFNFMHEVVPVMARQRSGSIINMASIAGQTGNPGQVNYSATKAGLIAMAKSVAKEMGSRGIRANSIAPGYIISDMTNALPEALRQEFVKQIPLRRGGTPEEVAKVALFLASDLSSYVSGQVIPVNGAMYC